METAEIIQHLLSINQSIATIEDKTELFENIDKSLHAIFDFSISGILVFDKTKSFFDIFYKGNIDVDKYPDLVVPQKERIEENENIPLLSKEIVRKDVDDIPDEGESDRRKTLFNELGILEFIFVPLLNKGDTIGFLILGCKWRGAIKDESFDFLKQISVLIALAVHNALVYEEISRKEREKEWQLQFTNALISTKSSREEMFTIFIREINKIISVDYMGTGIYQIPKDKLFFASYLKDENGEFVAVPIPNNKNAHIPFKKKCEEIPAPFVGFLTEEQFVEAGQQSPIIKFLREKYQIKTSLYVLIENSNKTKSIIFLGCKSSGGYEEKDADLIRDLLPQIALVFENLFAFEEIDALRKQLEQEKVYLLDEINTKDSGMEIIGNSTAIHHVIKRVKQVAPIDTTVLIGGETGTGKELIARALHRLSPRKDRAMVTINCASLPAQLIESELFGHERGSFTGAIDRRIGKFELASGGTIFLDEIGELPLELQAKLLRVLQEKEFERIGGKNTIHTDVRIIAATNRDLEKEAADGKFRSDLYFRLNVFPIIVPPLRERKEDIPLLVKFFMEKYSKRIGKGMKSIREVDMDKLINYAWPGNIRELEHTIERALIISNAHYLEVSDFVQAKPTFQKDYTQIKTLEEMEREHIVAALQITKGQITGENGAGRILGINGKTLGSKMRKLGIKREVTIKSEA